MTTRPQTAPRRDEPVRPAGAPRDTEARTTVARPSNAAAAARRRPAADAARPAREQDREARRFLGLSGPVWLLLALTLIALFCSRIYISRVESRLETALRPAPRLITYPQTSPVSIGDLRLSWLPVAGARDYRLHIQTAEGAVVVDGLAVREADWMPPMDALPGFPPGRYYWRVEARNEAGDTICRSDMESVEVR